MKKVAFITGAGGFIGSETALTLARAGIRIAVNDITEELTEKTVSRIRAEGGEAIGYPADVSNSAAIGAARNKAAIPAGIIC